MTIHAWGSPLWTSEIAAEFGDPGGRPLWLTNYYRGGGRVPNVAQNNAISQSGYIAHSMFYGAQNFPPAGQLLSTFCSGFNLYGTYTNGSGGTYNALIAHNSGSCGYAPINGRVAMNAYFSLDLTMAVSINFNTGNVTITWYYQYVGTPSTFNFTTGAGTGVIVGYDPDTFVPITSPPDSLVVKVAGPPDYYISLADNRDKIYLDGIGSSFAIANISLYDSITMHVANTSRSVVSGIVQPSAGNGWVGSFVLNDTPSNEGSGVITVTVDAN